jgi:hypothetical protein
MSYIEAYQEPKFKLSRRPGIDSTEAIPPAYVAEAKFLNFE